MKLAQKVGQGVAPHHLSATGVGGGTCSLIYSSASPALASFSVPGRHAYNAETLSATRGQAGSPSLVCFFVL